MTNKEWAIFNFCILFKVAFLYIGRSYIHIMYINASAVECESHSKSVHV